MQNNNSTALTTHELGPIPNSGSPDGYPPPQNQKNWFKENATNILVVVALITGTCTAMIYIAEKEAKEAVNTSVVGITKQMGKLTESVTALRGSVDVTNNDVGHLTRDLKDVQKTLEKVDDRIQNLNSSHLSTTNMPSTLTSNPVKL